MVVKMSDVSMSAFSAIFNPLQESRHQKNMSILQKRFQASSWWIIYENWLRNGFRNQLNMRQLHCNHAWYSGLYTLATRCHTCTAVTLKYTEASSLNPFFALDIFICSFCKCIQHTMRGQSNFPCQNCVVVTYLLY